MRILRATLGTVTVAGFLSVPVLAGAQTMGHDTTGTTKECVARWGATPIRTRR